MEPLMNLKPATPEIVWAMLQELTEKQAETDRQMKETDRQMQETKKLINETSRRMQETDRQMQETKKLIKESGMQMNETDRQMNETDRKLEKIGVLFGGMTDNQGCFAEEYFFNSFEKGKRNFFGEKFDDIKKNLKGIKTDDEFDIVMLNGHSVGIVEVKYKAHENDIPQVQRHANTFRTNFADYKNHKIYLGLATMAFYPALEKACEDNGIAIIKQAGDTIVINDKHLKAY